jgi:hypothetical protein
MGGLYQIGHLTYATDLLWQDNSGTIEREEFLSLPQVSSNPLATRLVFFSFPPSLVHLFFSIFAMGLFYEYQWYGVISSTRYTDIIQTQLFQNDCDFR